MDDNTISELEAKVNESDQAIRDMCITLNELADHVEKKLKQTAYEQGIPIMPRRKDVRISEYNPELTYQQLEMPEIDKTTGKDLTAIMTMIQKELLMYTLVRMRKVDKAVLEQHNEAYAKLIGYATLEQIDTERPKAEALLFISGKDSTSKRTFLVNVFSGTYEECSRGQAELLLKSARERRMNAYLLRNASDKINTECQLDHVIWELHEKYIQSKRENGANGVRMR